MKETTTHNRVRELDHRLADGIEVRLLWDASTDQLSVAVDDTRSGESFQLGVAAGDAMLAFHHPYAYAGYRRIASAPAA